jgi:hypothetical protein
MRDSNINSRSGRNVAGLAGLLFLVGTEKSRKTLTIFVKSRLIKCQQKKLNQYP